MAAILNFKYTTGAGDGDYSHPHPLGSFDTHARWQPVTLGFGGSFLINFVKVGKYAVTSVNWN